MMADRWHYPRTEFAERIWTLLANGPARGLSLFGPRRTGKTQFLIRDLAPLAEAKGHRVVYVSLWQTLDTPLAILLYEFDLALRSGSFSGRLRAAVGAMAPKFKVKGPAGTGEVEIDFSSLKGRAPEHHLLLLDQYCERLANDKKPALLLFDEFQELARATAAGPLIAALRTSLDKRKAGLVSIFTGSSQDGLRAMFSAREAPFYRFAAPIELPPLDEAFVDHQLSAFKATSRASIERAHALETFERFNRNPMFFQRWLTHIALRPDLAKGDTILQVQHDIAEEFGFGKRWLDLRPTQRLVARLLAERSTEVYGQIAGRRITELTGRPPPAASQLQSALSRLSRLGLAEKFEDGWRLADPLFETFVRDRPASDF